MLFLIFLILLIGAAVMIYQLNNAPEYTESSNKKASPYSGNPLVFGNSAYHEGYDRYFDGLNKNDNPYSEDEEPDKFHDWETGWLRADSDCDDN